MSNKKPTVETAVITRTKNRPLLLERAIKSVHRQSNKDFVHIIINDGGDSEPIERLLEKHKKLITNRVKVIHNKRSNGMEAASNKAIRSVNSTFVAIHDDDDTWHPDFLKLTTKHLKITGAKGVVVKTDKIIEEIKNGKIYTKEKAPFMPGLETISLYRQFIHNQVTPITFIHRREVFDVIGYYDESLPVTGDWEFAVRFLLKYDIDFLHTKNVLAYYHLRPGLSGDSGNSVLVNGGNSITQQTSKNSNKLLRDDIEKVGVGPGFIGNLIQGQMEVTSRIIDEKNNDIRREAVSTRREINNLKDLLIKRTSLVYRIKSIFKHK